MNDFEIDIALEFANKRKKTRLKNNNKFYRRRVRSELHHYLYYSESLDIELSVIEDLNSTKLNNSNENNFNKSDV